MNIVPLGDKILIKPIRSEEKTSGGIYIPESSQEKPQKGEVLEVGNGNLLDDGSYKPINVNKGDVVLFNKYGGVEVKLEGIDYKIISERDILGIIKD